MPTFTDERARAHEEMGGLKEAIRQSMLSHQHGTQAPSADLHRVFLGAPPAAAPPPPASGAASGATASPQPYASIRLRGGKVVGVGDFVDLISPQPLPDFHNTHESITPDGRNPVRPLPTVTEWYLSENNDQSRRRDDPEWSPVGMRIFVAEGDVLGQYFILSLEQGGRRQADLGGGEGYLVKGKWGRVTDRGRGWLWGHNTDEYKVRFDGNEERLTTHAGGKSKWVKLRGANGGGPNSRAFITSNRPYDKAVPDYGPGAGRGAAAGAGLLAAAAAMVGVVSGGGGGARSTRKRKSHKRSTRKRKSRKRSTRKRKSRKRSARKR